MKKIYIVIILMVSIFSTLEADSMERRLNYISNTQMKVLSDMRADIYYFDEIFKKYNSSEAKALRGWFHLINETDHNTRYFLSNSKSWLVGIVEHLRFTMSRDDFRYVENMVNDALSIRESRPNNLINQSYVVTAQKLNLRRVPLLLDIVKKGFFEKGDIINIQYSLYHNGGEWGYIVSKRGWVNLRYLREVL